MGRRLVIGDIHGRYSALKEVLEKSNFDYEKDLLICLGDVCDGNNGVKRCFDELLKIKNFIYILGNHDFWARDWFNFGLKPNIWTGQGGKATIQSYNFDYEFVPTRHVALLNYEAKPYYLTDDNILFVHGGINPDIPLEENTLHTCMWDRELIFKAKKEKIGDYKHIYVGHTVTQGVGTGKADKPLTFNNLTMVDTGCGYIGRLTIMDVDSGEYWQSKDYRGFS